jgi:hypothetical protein
MADELSNVLTQLGQFATSPQMPVMAGQLGAAAMGRNQNSWQANVGRVASGFGQSAIAANEAKAQGDKGKQMNDWLQQILPAILSGVKMTPEGVAGPSKTKVEVNPDGTYKTVVEGNATTTGGNAPTGAPVGTNSVLPPGSPVAPATAPTQPVRAPGVNPRLLPF